MRQEIDGIIHDWTVLESRGMPERATNILDSLDHNQTDFRALYELGRLSPDIAGVLALARTAGDVASRLTTSSE
jgi:hypothetical protein